MMRAKSIAVALAALAAAAFSPAVAAAQTIEEALAQAYNYSADLAAFRARLRATDESVAIAMSGWRPTLTFSANAGTGWRETSGTGNSDVHIYPRGESLSLSQNLYRGGRTVAAVRQAEYLVQSDRAALLDLEQQVLLQAATAYLDVLRDRAVLDLNVNNERVLGRELEATRDRFQVGEVTRTDVAQSESRLAAAKASRIAAEGTLANSRATYVRLVGEAPGVLQPVSPPEALPASVGEAEAIAAEKAYLLQAAHYTQLAARENVDVIFGEMLPLVTLNGQLADSRDATVPTGRVKSATLSVVATVPLYEAGSVAARVRQAKEIAAQRREEVDRQRRLAVQTAAQAWDALVTARAQVTSFAAQANAARIALNGVQQEQQVGSRTVLDVLNAEQELLIAQVNQVRAEHDVAVQAFALRAAVATLTARQIGLPVDILDVEKHYEDTRTRFFGISTDSEDDK